LKQKTSVLASLDTLR